MIEVTENAGSMIKDFLKKQQEPLAIRLYLQAG